MDSFSKRRYIIGGIFLFVGLAFLIKLFGLQVINTTYKQFATKNVLRRVVTFPARGLIYDRNQKLMVYNKAAYDLLIVPREVKQFDTIALCSLIDIEKEELIDAIKKAKKYSYYKPSVVVKQISPDIYAPLQEKLYKYPGFFVQSRTLREYPAKAAAQILGYIGEVTSTDISKDYYYKSGDYIGVTGLERAYEKELRGIKGINHYMVDVHNRIKGKYKNSQMDTSAVLGRNIVSTLDTELQSYAELLMQNKKGSVVIIEPESGEILTMVSVPTYDPNLLVGRSRNKNFNILFNDTLKPLFNRSVTATYSPGSTFKLLNALIALQENSLSTATHFYCSGPNSTPIKCTHYHQTPLSMREGIRESCNPYFWNVFKSIIRKYPSAESGFGTWRNYVINFGFGKKICPELFSEVSGNIPKIEYYDQFYGKHHWNEMTVRSLAIGQGEISVTPLQMANMAAIIANRGYYITPHLVRSVQSENNKEYNKLIFERKNTGIYPENFSTIIEGMQSVVEETSNRYNTMINDITICGKTGTIQNPHGSDHSAFIAFAPKENPQIAIAVYVENGVWGARYAAPIASLLIEKYINGEISSPRRKAIEQRMIEANLLDNIQPE